jgi:hypothetical protein
VCRRRPRKRPRSRWSRTQRKSADKRLSYSTLGKKLRLARLASTLLGESPGPSETGQHGDHIGAAATIISPEDPTRDPTTAPLPDVSVSALIDTGATHNFISREAVAKAGLKPLKRLASAVSLINGTELPIAGVYRETLRITDVNQETRLQTLTLP